jgi:hypothetical protein
MPSGGALFVEAVRAGRHRSVARLPVRALLEQLVDAALRRQREHLVALGMAGDHVQRVDADRAGRAEDADALSLVAALCARRRRADGSGLQSGFDRAAARRR